MKIARFAICSLNDVSHLKPYRSFLPRSLSTNANANEDPRNRQTPFDSSDNLDRFGDYTGNDEKSNDFFKHLGKAEKDKRGGGGSRFNRDETFDPSSDGVDGKLKEAALRYNIDEGGQGFNDSYFFRKDFTSYGQTNYPKDFSFKRQIQRQRQNIKSEVTTEEVLRKADFRNVRFLAQFITEAGILVKRKQTGISAKAQRKIAREIKTARAFGLMPFTTMGTKAFQFGKTMENRDQDFEYEAPDDDDLDEDVA